MALVDPSAPKPISPETQKTIDSLKAMRKRFMANPEASPTPAELVLLDQAATALEKSGQPEPKAERPEHLPRPPARPAPQQPPQTGAPQKPPGGRTTMGREPLSDQE